MLFRDQHVKRWHDKQSENRSDSHPANENETDGISRGRAGARDESQRKMAGDGGNACHHDRPQTDPRGLCHRGKFTRTLPLQFVRELHDQDSVFRHQSDKRDQTDLRVNVESSRPALGKKRNVRIRHLQESEKQRAKHGERHRAEQNNEWIAEAVELSGENEKDQYDCERKSREKFIPLRAQLTRVARVIKDVTFRQNLACFVFEKFQRGIERLT